MAKSNIEHATADELVQLSNMNELIYPDCVVLADALLVVTYLKHLKDKAIRANDHGMEMLYEGILKHE